MMWLLKRVLVVGVSEGFSAGTAPSRGSVVNIVRMKRDIQKNRVEEKVGEEERGVAVHVTYLSARYRRGLSHAAGANVQIGRALVG